MRDICLAIFCLCILWSICLLFVSKRYCLFCSKSAVIELSNYFNYEFRIRLCFSLNFHVACIFVPLFVFRFFALCFVILGVLRISLITLILSCFVCLTNQHVYFAFLLCHYCIYSCAYFYSLFTVFGTDAVFVTSELFSFVNSRFLSEKSVGYDWPLFFEHLA